MVTACPLLPGLFTPWQASPSVGAMATISSRDAGLVRGIGPFALTGAFMGMLVGSGIFNVPAPMAAAVGSYAPLAYVACAVAMSAVMLVFAEGSSRVPTTGGCAGFVGAAFGPYWGFLAAVLVWSSVVASAGGITAAAVDIIGALLPAIAQGPARAIAIAGWLLSLALLNTLGVGVAARVVAIATSIKMLPLLLFIGVGIWFMTPANLTLPLADSSSDLGRAAILGIFLFTGLEGSLAIAGEVKNPARTIPRAVIASMLAYALLCILIQMVAQGLLGADLAASKAPLPQAMAQISAPLAVILGAGAVVSMLGWTASDALSSPRLLFAMARDGILPRVIGRLHPRTHAPYVASFTHAAIAAGLAISGSFEALAVLATLLAVLIYLLGCAAVLRLRADNVALAGPPVVMPGLKLLAFGGSAAMLWVASNSTAVEAIGIAAFLAAASALYGWRRNKRV